VASAAPDGDEFTVTTWTDDIVSLLPAADVIAFPKHDAGVCSGSRGRSWRRRSG